MGRFTSICMFAGTLTLAACYKGGTPNVLNPTPVPSVSPSPSSSPYTGPRIGAYNFASTATTLTTYPLMANGSTNPVQLIAGPLTQLAQGTTGTAFDSSGNIYAGVGTSTTAVLVFSKSATQNVPPDRTLMLPIQALGIAMDSLGNFYTSNFKTGALYRFPALGSGAVAPSATFTPELRTPSGLKPAFAFVLATATNDVFCGCVVTSGGTTVGVSQYSVSGAGVPTLITSFYDPHLVGRPLAVAVDPVAKLVYVGLVFNGAPAVLAYSEKDGGLAKPARSPLTGPNTGIQSINGLAVDSTGELYVADSASHQIEVFAATASGNVTANRIISDTNLQFAISGNSIAIH